eukprot:scaffold7.g3516.t1
MDSYGAFAASSFEGTPNARFEGPGAKASHGSYGWELDDGQELRIPAARPPAGPPPPSPGVFFTSAQLTLSPASTPSTGSPPRAGFGAAPLPPAQQRQPGQPSPTAAAIIGAQQDHIRGLGLANSELQQRVAQLEAQLVASAQTAQATGAASTPPPADDAEVRELHSRLASREREAQGLRQALDQHARQLAAQRSELEVARDREGSLLDELASWKDVAVNVEKQQGGLVRRLESATSQTGLLDDALAAQKRQTADLETALAQAQAHIRQLQDALREAQGTGARAAAVAAEGEAARREAEAAHANAENARAEAADARAEAVALWQRLRAGEGEQQQLTEALLMAQQEAAALRERCRALESAVAEAARAGARPGTAGPASYAQPGLVQQYSAGAAGNRSPSPGYGWQPPHQQLAYVAGPPSQAFELDGPSPVGQPHYRGDGLQRTWQEDRNSPWPPPGAWSAGSDGGDPRASAMPPPQQQQQGELHLNGAPEDMRAGYSLRSQGSDYALSSVAPPLGRPSQPPSLAASTRYPAGAGQLGGPWGSEEEAASVRSGPSSRGGGAPVPYPGHRTPAPQWSQQDEPSSGDDVASQLSALSLRQQPQRVQQKTQGPPASPFGTERTLEEMLARTQALEERLTALAAERNDLQAEYSRMPTTTAGRTLQARSAHSHSSMTCAHVWVNGERKRRAEVERRLEEIGKEQSSVRLQLKRLGAV